MKRLLAIMLAVAMLFGLIPSNTVVFAQDEVESTELLLDTVLGNRDISKETWTVQLSDGTVIPNAKVSSNKNAFMPMVVYIAEFTQADLDQLAAPGKRISILGKGHSIEVKKGKGQVFSKLVNGVPTVKDEVYCVSFNYPWIDTASVEEGVIVINAEFVDKNVAWKLETVDGKSLEGTVTLEGDHYVVKLNRASVKEAVVEGKTFLGIDVNKGGVYSSDTQKICDYTYLKADNDTLEYEFEAQLVSSVSEGKILFDLIATDTKTTPTWTIKTNHGLTLPVTRQDFLNFIESPNDTYPARNPFQNWVFGVYIDKDELAKELKKHGYELIGFGPDQTRNTVVKMFGTEYSLDGAVKEFEETATIKQNTKYFFDIDVDPDTGEYYCKIRLNESDKLIDLQSVELYLDIEMKASNRVLVDPNGGKVRIEDPVTSDVVMHEKEFELVFGANEELKDLPLAFKKGESFLGWFNKDNGEKVQFPIEVKGEHQIEARYKELPGKDQNYGFTVFAKFEGKDELHLLKGYTIERNLEHENESTTAVFTISIKTPELKKQVEDLGYLFSKDIESEIDVLDYLNYIDYDDGDLFDDPDEVSEDLPITVSDETTDVQYSFFYREAAGQVEGGKVIFVLKDNPIEKYKVTFDPNGGTLDGLTAVKEVEVVKDKTVDQPSDPVNDGYTFLHWAIDSETGKKFNFGKPINADIMLVAKYELDGVKVTLDMGDGSLYVDNKFVKGSHTLIFPENAQFEPTNYQFYLKGKTIDHWVDEAGNKVTFPVALTKNVTFIAVYRDVTDTNNQLFKHFTRLENQNDADKEEVVGTTQRTSRTVTSDPTRTEEQYTTEIDNRELAKALGLPAVEVVDIIVFLDGYNKFSDQPEGLIAEKVKSDYNQVEGKSKVVYKTLMSSDEGQVEGGRVVVIVKEKKFFTVTFDLKGGKLDGKTEKIKVKVDINATVASIGNPTKDGYTFKHWTVETGAGTAVYNFATPVDRDLTLVAVYEANNTGGNSGGGGSNPNPIVPGFDFPIIGTETVEIEEEETPLSKVLSDDVLINGQKTGISVEKDGTVVVTAEDLKGLKEPVLMAIKMANADNFFVTYQKKDEKSQMIPVSLYFDGRMYVVIEGPGKYITKRNRLWLRGLDDNHWARPFLELVSARKIMVGNEDGEFMPNMLTTRAMLTQILARMQFAELETTKSNHYDDVSAEKWYANSVNWATEKGIVTGIGDGKFAPEDIITREQLAVMIHRYLKFNNWKLEMKVGAIQFKDHDAISDWAKDAVTELKDYGIFEGKPGYIFDPQAKVTRAEVATVVAKLIEMYLKSIMIRY